MQDPTVDTELERSSGFTLYCPHCEKRPEIPRLWEVWYFPAVRDHPQPGACPSCGRSDWVPYAVYPWEEEEAGGDAQRAILEKAKDQAVYMFREGIFKASHGSSPEEVAFWRGQADTANLMFKAITGRTVAKADSSRCWDIYLRGIGIETDG